MKTFLYSIPNKIQSFSKKLDVKAALCGRSWEVFNDEGVKQLFIFNEDESILISNNGKVFNASWKFIPQNSSILITTGDETIMFRPAFFNKDVFVLQQDGVERYLFMIDEEKMSSFPDLSLDTLDAYIEKEIAEAPITKQQFEIEKQQKEKETKRQNKETERSLLLDYMKTHNEEITRTLSHRKTIGTTGIAVCSFLLIGLEFFLFPNVANMIGVCSIAIIIMILFRETLVKSSPIDIIEPHLENGVRYHNDEEVRKLYEEL